MGERSGLGAQIGFAQEEEWGKFKAPTRFLPFETESLDLTKNYVASKGLVAGRVMQRKNLHRAITKTVGGSVGLELLDTGLGMLLNLFTGEVVTPTKIEEGKAYKALFKIGLSSPYGKSLTAQVGRPDTGGTSNPFSYMGLVLTAAKISFDSKGFAMLEVTFDGKDGTTKEALAAASYSATALPFAFDEIVPKIGGVQVGNMESLEVDFTFPKKVDRFNLGNSGTKSEQIPNDYIDVSAKATLEFGSMADYNRFTEETVVELTANATGAEIDAKNKKAFNLTLKATKQTDGGVNVSGPDMLTSSATFEALDDGTNPPVTIETISEDSAL